MRNPDKINHNPDLDSREKEQILGLVESFRNNTPWISYDILLKTILFSLVFYLVNSELLSMYLTRYLPKVVDRLLIQAIIFGIAFYSISSQI